MKLLVVTIFACNASLYPLKADVDTEIAELKNTYNGINKQIQSMPVNERAGHYQKLSEQICDLVYAHLYIPNGEDKVDINTKDDMLVRLIWTSYEADQRHLVRSIIHHDNDADAIAIMCARVKSMIGAYPICRSDPKRQIDLDSAAYFERVSYTACIARAFHYAPNSVLADVRNQIDRLQGEERIPALTLLAESGDIDAKNELAKYDGKHSGMIKKIFDITLNSERGRVP